MAIKIVTDSASDILPQEAEQLGITVVPLTVTFEGKEYADAIDLNHTQFFEKLIESDALPTTSQVSPAAFEEVFRELTKNGDSVLYLAVSSKLSGTCQSGFIAASEVEGQVVVLDTLNVTVGQRLLVLNALSYIRQGLSMEEVLERLEEDKKHVRVIAMLDTLEYLKKGGRISAAVAFAGGLLNIKPVVSVVEGEVAMIGKARGSKSGNNLLRKLVEDCGGIDFSQPLCLVYSGLSDHLLRKYIEDSTDLWHGHTQELPIATIGSVIGTHVGPGAIGLAFFEK